ncbi:DNA mismatch repair protein MSH4 [Diplonema papillatum]|nr:DNA mismatch repair protein MSH4 [Diplonema papillatum]
MPGANDGFLVESTIRHILGLRGVIQATPTVAGLLDRVPSEILLLRHIEKALAAADLSDVLTSINELIRPPEDGLNLLNSSKGKRDLLTIRTLHVFAIRTGIDGILEAVRQRYLYLVQEITEYTTQLAQDLSITSLKYISRPERGIIFQCDRVELKKGGDTFVQVVVTKKSAMFTTHHLMSLNNKLWMAYKEVVKRTMVRIEALVHDIRKKMTSFYRVSEAMSLLDMLQSAAVHATVHEGYTRPSFVDPADAATGIGKQPDEKAEVKIRIVAGRHPLEEIRLAMFKEAKSAFSSADQGGLRPSGYIPNDTEASGGVSFLLLSGPNMSGKTTYLLQVATILVLGHVGYYVPAKEAELPLLDRLYTRLGMDDSLEANASTFHVEMRDCASLLHGATDRSFVVIDELGRGTSNLEGAAIAFAVSEALVERKTLTLLATHYVQLHELATAYPSAVQNVHFTVKPNASSGTLQCLYKVEEGSCSVERYGLALARQMGFPPDFMRQAEAFERALTESEAKTVDQLRNEDEWTLLHRFADRILAVCHDSDDGESSPGRRKPRRSTADTRAALTRVKQDLARVIVRPTRQGEVVAGSGGDTPYQMAQRARCAVDDATFAESAPPCKRSRGGPPPHPAAPVPGDSACGTPGDTTDKATGSPVSAGANQRGQQPGPAGGEALNVASSDGGCSRFWAFLEGEAEDGEELTQTVPSKPSRRAGRDASELSVWGSEGVAGRVRESEEGERRARQAELRCRLAGGADRATVANSDTDCVTATTPDALLSSAALMHPTQLLRRKRKFRGSAMPPVSASGGSLCLTSTATPVPSSSVKTDASLVDSSTVLSSSIRGTPGGLLKPAELCLAEAALDAVTGKPRALLSKTLMVDDAVPGFHAESEGGRRNDVTEEEPAFDDDLASFWQ